MPQRSVQVVGDTEETGTKVTFLPDKEIFETTDFVYDTLKIRLRELAYLNKGLRITLEDKRAGQEKKDSFCYEGGIRSFVEDLNASREQLLFPQPLYFEEADGDTMCEVAIQYNESYNEVIYSYANNVNTIDGGTHVEGLRLALTKVINDYGKKAGLMKESDKLSRRGRARRHHGGGFRKTRKRAVRIADERQTEQFVHPFVCKPVRYRAFKRVYGRESERRERLVMRCLTARKRATRRVRHAI